MHLNPSSKATGSTDILTHVQVLDSALLRPGRFDRQVTVDRPDVQGRVKVLKVHSRGKSIGKDVDFDKVARRTPGKPLIQDLKLPSADPTVHSSQRTWRLPAFTAPWGASCMQKQCLLLLIYVVDTSLAENPANGHMQNYGACVQASRAQTCRT